MRVLLLLLLAAIPAAMPALALESAPASTPHAAVSLIAAEDSVAPGEPLRLGLRFRLAPGWHTYWQNPGDAGAPPSLTLTGAKAGPLQFPVPERLEEAGLVSYAYENEVVLPFTAAPVGAGPAVLAASVDYLVCAKVCIPEQAALALTIPAGAGAAGPDAPRVAAAIAALPRPSPFPATVSADGVLRLTAPGLAPRAALFLPAAPGIVDQLAPQSLSVVDGGLTLRLKPLAPLAHPLAGVLTLTDAHGGSSALAIDAPIAAPVTPAPAPGLAQALLLALAGGLILNLMPCVLPVLAMKAAALARLGGGARAEVRREAALYVAGVLVAFAAIGALVLALGAAGHAVGWGAQFQSAAFTALTAWLMLLIGLNFLGVFEVGTSLGGLGGALGRHGSFLTGLLAVAVATPCTGPFMATALAAAAALPPLAGLLIFLALGAGLAAPYALLAAVPAAARLLPRPGRWMLTLKHVLAVPMLAAAAFFGWVVFRQAGWFGVLPALIGGGLLGGAAYLIGLTQQGRAQPGTPLAIPVALVIALFQLLPIMRAAAHGPALATMAASERFSPDRLAALRAQHRPVLVDMSAAWCITCLVNERIALAPEAVRHAMARHGAVLLRGDWTRQDPEITAYLKQWGRTGVPLYVFYPVAGAPEVLPQILTQADILGRLGA